MPTLKPHPGTQVFMLHEADCACGQKSTHLILRPAEIRGRAAEPGSVWIHVRGWCDACSPAVVKDEKPVKPAPTWWQRLVEGLTA